MGLKRNHNNNNGFNHMNSPMLIAREHFPSMPLALNGGGVPGPGHMGIFSDAACPSNDRCLQCPGYCRNIRKGNFCLAGGGVKQIFY